MPNLPQSQFVDRAEVVEGRPATVALACAAEKRFRNDGANIVNIYDTLLSTPGARALLSTAVRG